MMMKRFILLTLPFLILGACSEQEAPKKTPKPVSSIVIDATKAYDSRVISGVIQQADTTDLTFEVPGKVEAVYFELGERFEKGAPLAKLEQNNYLLIVKEREGQVSEAKSRLLEAQKDFKRKQDLVKDGAVSRSQFDVSKSQFDSAKDQVEIAEARLGIAQEDLADTVLTAPYDGSLAARYIEPSQRVSPNAPALMVQGENGLEVSVLAPEAMLSSIEIGKSARVDIPALNMGFDSVIIEIGSAAEEANAFPVILKILSENTQKLKTGMSAEATFKLDRAVASQNGIILPVSAILADAQDSHFIYKVLENTETRLSESDDEKQSEAIKNAEYFLSKSPIKVVQFFDQHAIVSGEVKEGERIIDAGLAFLQDGQAVSIIDEGKRLYNP